MVESGEFAETQVQRPPDQMYSFPRIYRSIAPLLSSLSRGGKERSDRVVSLLRHMLQSARSKSATKKSLSKKSSVSGKAPTPKGFKCGLARCVGATSAGSDFKRNPVYIVLRLARRGG